MQTVTVVLPPNLALYIGRFFSVTRFRFNGAIGPMLRSVEFHPLQDKFVSDVAHALHNITSSSMGPIPETSGAEFFFAQAKLINSAWLPEKEMLLTDKDGGHSRGFAELYPLPESPGE